MFVYFIFNFSNHIGGSTSPKYGRILCLSCVSYFSQQSLMFLFLVHIVFFQPGEGKGSARLSCPGNTTAAIAAVDVVTPTTLRDTGFVIMIIKNAVSFLSSVESWMFFTANKADSVCELLPTWRVNLLPTDFFLCWLTVDSCC